MIDMANLTDYLTDRGFRGSGSRYGKSHHDPAHEIVVDLNRRTIAYPEALAVHDGTMSDLDHPGNLVVLDCVDRLMENGYRPDRIELGMRWGQGHTAEGGRADVCVRDRAGDAYLIVECETPGDEYDGARERLDSDGGRLFPCWRLESGTRWLCLYTADFSDGRTVYDGCCINVSLPRYQTAETIRERHRIWADVFARRTLGAGVAFSGDPYRIGEHPLTKRDLRALTPADESDFIRDFKGILRRHGISDGGNAFNRLVALLICKIADELGRDDGEALDFQIGYSDTYELVHDRLRMLYGRGMGRFLHEDIHYPGPDHPTARTPRHRGSPCEEESMGNPRDAMRALRFYTNGDFAFKDIHNDGQFRENGMILFEVVRLLQPYRIVCPSGHQMLGDLFEILLDSGFRQDEGQFFTPTPIARFIWDSLPPSLIAPGGEPPRMIDFACGSAHLLSEGVSLVNDLRGDSDTAWCADRVYGIEKDDRLARVSKVSLLMNGVIGGDIIRGDGLCEFDDIRDGSFDVVVSNPPYSVAGFKRYLPQSVRDRLSLSEGITDSGNQIESLFVERADELLRADGICVLVLPTALLSNADPTSIATRRFILRRFVVNAIVDMGTKTFQDTGTPTSIVFMRKRHQPPEQWRTIGDDVDADAAFPRNAGNPSSDDGDGADGFEGFLDRVGLDRTAFDALLGDEGDWWLDDALTCGMRPPKAIESSMRTRFRFRRECLNAMNDAFHYYLLAGPGSLVYVRAPSSAREQERFLGYRWSSGRGANGLIALGRNSPLDGYGTRAPDGSIAALIRRSLLSDLRDSTPVPPPYSKVLPMRDAIDFIGGDIFDCEERIEVRWNCGTVALGDLCPGLTIGGTPDTRNPHLYEGDVQWASIADLKDAMNRGEARLGPTRRTIAASALPSKRSLPKDTLLVSFKLTIGACAFTTAKETFTNEAIAALSPKGGMDDGLYLYCLIASGALPMIPRGTKKIGRSYNKRTLANVRIPYPDARTREGVVRQSIDADRHWIGGPRAARERILLALAGRSESNRILSLLEIA